MDQATTTTSGFDSVLDCEPLGGNTCPAPVVPCQDYTPPMLRFVRIAATNAHDFFTTAHEDLQDATIEDILSIDQIIADFAPDAPANGFNYVNAIAGGFNLASGIATLLGDPAGPILALISGVFTLANAIDPPKEPVDQTDEWQRILSNQLGQTFSQTADAISGLNNKLFGGSDDFDLDGLVSSIQSTGVIPTTAGYNAITDIFSTGAFLANQDDSPLDDALKAGYQRIKLSLVAGLLRAENFYVFINTQLGEGDCVWTGSRFINNECMIISKRNDDLGSHTEPVNSTILLKLDDANAGYNIDVEELYQNAIDCGGAPLDTSVTFSTALPKCFWSLPILKVDGPDVCDLIPDGLASAQGYPAGVDLTLASC